MLKNSLKTFILTLLLLIAPVFLPGAELPPCEKTYNTHGQYKAVTDIHPVKNRKWKKFTVSYPETVKTSARKLPVIVFCNGTLVPASLYLGVFDYMASWGFIAIGSEEKWSARGEGAIAALDFLKKLDQDKSSALYQRVDWQRVGLAGHSQGGAGVYNAATRYKQSAIFKALFAMSPCNKKLAAMWPLNAGYDLSKVKVPIMLTASANPKGWDEYDPFVPFSGIAPLSSLQENRDELCKNSPCVVLARLSSLKHTHANMFGESLPYMTAWFLYHLQGNTDAGSFFCGKDPELLKNPRWQDVSIDWKK